NVCLATIGLGGSDSAYDEPFLRQLASNSGCGGFHTAVDSYQLEDVYIGLSHEASGVVLGRARGRVGAGERTELAAVSVPGGQIAVCAALVVGLVARPRRAPKPVRVAARQPAPERPVRVHASPAGALRLGSQRVVIKTEGALLGRDPLGDLVLGSDRKVSRR